MSTFSSRSERYQFKKKGAIDARPMGRQTLTVLRNGDGEPVGMALVDTRRWSRLAQRARRLARRANISAAWLLSSAIDWSRVAVN
jgi:hypothetical protein